MTERAHAGAMFDHPILADLQCINMFGGARRKIQMEIRLPRSAPARPSGGGVEQRQRLRTLVAQMVQTAGSQTECLDIQALHRAFAPLRDTVYQQQGVRAYSVRLDERSLLQLAKVQATPGDFFVLHAVPEGLVAIQQEIVELCLNCAVLPSIPDFVCDFENLQVLALDGKSNVWKTKWSMSLAKLVELPQKLGSLLSLTTLSLVNLPLVSTMPPSIASLTGLTSLSIDNCPKLAGLPEMGNMPCLRKLVLRGPCARNVPGSVGSWSLTELTMECESPNVQEHDYLPPKFLARLASSLESLCLSVCLQSHLDAMPLMPKLKTLVITPLDDDFLDDVEDGLVVCVTKVPALQHLDGVCDVLYGQQTLTSLRYLRLFQCSEMQQSFGGCVTSLLHLVVHGKHLHKDLPRLPGWFGVEVFPNLQTLCLESCVDLPLLPASIASLTGLTQLDLHEIGVWESQITTRIAPPIFQMASLRSISMTECDFTTLPSMFLPCLEILRISKCEYLYELPVFPAGLLPKLAVLELHQLCSIFALPESLGGLTALTRLHIAACPLSSVPKSLQSLTALRELTIDCVGRFSSTDLVTHPLLTEVAYCLPALRSLTKLCVRGVPSRSAAQCGNDLVAIGCALRAWPLPLLDPMLVQLPVLGLRTPHSNSDDVGTFLLANAGFGFKSSWSDLGLPTEAASWDDAGILDHWRQEQQKLLAFTCAWHSRLGRGSAVSVLSQQAIIMVADKLSGGHSFVHRDLALVHKRTHQQQLERQRKIAFMQESEEGVQEAHKALHKMIVKHEQQQDQQDQALALRQQSLEEHRRINNLQRLQQRALQQLQDLETEAQRAQVLARIGQLICEGHALTSTRTENSRHCL